MGDFQYHISILKYLTEGKFADLTDTREIVLTADTMDAYIALFGLNDRNISVIEQECSVNIALRGNHLLIQGDSDHLELAEQTIQILFGMISRNESVDRLRIRYVISMGMRTVLRNP